MDRHRQIGAFWNWLPGFRAAAEAEHLPTAAERVHVTPAALSRTVRLLEDAIGKPLFHRQGGRLQLNDDGRVLLDATRTAMRILHDAATAIEGSRLDGPVRMASGGVGQIYAMRALLLARERLPGMRPVLRSTPPESVAEALLVGELDLCVSSVVVRADGLTTELLTHATSGVYCGPSHPLFGCAEVALDTVREHAFTAPPPGPAGTSTDGWPPELDRRVDLVVDRMAAGMEICGRTDLLAVLPDTFAASSPVPLHRLPLDGVVPDTPVVAIRRAPTGADDLTERLTALLREVCAP